MFGRKKEKRRHKPGMTQAEISKLEEIGTKRGFFHKKTSKRDKDEGLQKRDISRPLSVIHQDGESKSELPSVLQRATMYGSVVQPQRRTSLTSSSSKPPQNVSTQPISSQDVEANRKFPVPPMRRKVSTKSTHSSGPTPHYDIPKPPGPGGAPGPELYSVPRSWNHSTSEAPSQPSNFNCTAPKRKVVLKKRPGGDFGVSLRRSLMNEYINDQEVKRTFYFAEPGVAMRYDEEQDEHKSSRLYPGDRLLEIDGVNVENATRDEIVARIKTAGSQVTLVVQSLQNLDEVPVNDGMESQYSTPRNIDGSIWTESKHRPLSPQLNNTVKDDGIPKLPAARKKDTKEIPRVTSQKGFITRQRSWDAKLGASSSKLVPKTQSRSLSVCSANSPTMHVTPSELHASSMLTDSATKSNLLEASANDESALSLTPSRNEAESMSSLYKQLKNKGEGGSADEKCEDHSYVDAECSDERVNVENKSEMKENICLKCPSDDLDVAIDYATCNGSNESEIVEKIANPSLDSVSAEDPSHIEAGVQKEEDSIKKVPPEPEIIEVSSSLGITWTNKEEVWFRTTSGISEAHIVEPDIKGGEGVPDVPEGKKRIKLVQSGMVIMVPEDDVEMANDAQFDRVVDVTKLRHLNECSLLHTLSQRYEGGLSYSMAGPYLISIKLPYHHSASAIHFTTKLKQTYKGTRFGDTPAHLYVTAQRAYQDMMSSLSDQCIVCLGFTASAKTSNSLQLLTYYANIASHSSKPFTEDKVVSVVNILESFSSASTKQCKSASRCVRVYNLDFDRTGQLVAMSIQALLLDRSRLIKRGNGEANFNVFYQMVLGADTQLRRELFLLDLEQESNPLITSSFSSNDNFHQSAIKGFASLQKSFTVLGFSDDEVKAIYMVLAACLHLGLAGSQRVSSTKYQFARADSAQKASSLLGVTVENLSKAIFQLLPSGKRSRTSSSASLKRSNSSLSNIPNLPTLNEEQKENGQQALDAFIVGLYTEVFRSIVSLINRSLSSPQRAQNTILVVDPPGYQGWCENSHPASFSDLTYNYVQDRLHALFHNNAFTTYKDRYRQEGIDCDVVIPDDNFTSSVEVVDQPPAIGSSGAKGLLWMLDEESSSPNASDENFIERLLSVNHAPQPNGSSLQRSPNPGRFILRHQGGECRVEYDSSGWLAYAFYNSTVSTASDVLQDSKKNYISQMFGSGRETMHGSVASLKLDGGGANLKRASSFRKGWSSQSGAAAAVKKSVCMLTKFQTDGLVDMVRRTQSHFILSVAPQVGGNDSEDTALDIAFVRKQLRGFQLLSSARTFKQGYPEHLVYSEFRRRFDVLLRHISSDLPNNSTSIALLEDREATENIIKHLELSRSQFRMGASQVFFRSGVLNMLEDKRNEKVSSVIIAFQASCRGYLARKRYERKKVQVVAVRCIQRNVRKFMAIRQWPWWRLLTKVLPLVEVTRTEEELREKQAEYDLLKEKFDRVQTERDDLKLSSSKYEIQLQDLMLHLEEERTTASHASDLLEHERKERMRLDKVLKETQNSHNHLQDRVETLEVQLAEKKLLYSEHISLDSDDEAEDGVYKAKYEKAVREYNFQSKQKAQEYENSLEEIQSDKKALERKLSQLYEELDDLRRVENQTKKKLHRITAELSDAQIHLEETTIKNHELEKKQRKFDSELYAAQANVTELKTARDRIQREKDKIVLEKKDAEQELDDKSDEVDSLMKKIRRLEEELEDNNQKDTDDKQSVNALKKQIRELDAKVKDQEEELEEQASTIHTLEHAKERLEMSAEQARQQRQREVEGKEDELEEMRASYHKKIKQLEMQLEEAEEERATMSKQKRELEQEVQNAKDFGMNSHDAESERRLRKDLKRYKALLADAQTMIDHLKADVVSKQQMRQLKAQVEDLQYTSAAAVKSRKTIELEVEDLQAQLEEISKSKQETESRVSGLQREAHELHSKLEEDAEDSQETLRKYRSLVNQQADDRRALVEAQGNLEEMKREKSQLDEKIINLQHQIDYLEESTTDNATVKRLEGKVKDLETKLEFQKTTARRLEVQLNRAKENNDKTVQERDSHIAAEHREKEALKRIQRQLRESKEEQAAMLKREQEALQKKHDLEMEVSEHQNQIDSLQSDLKLAFKRISDLQISLEELEESDLDENDDDDLSSSDDEDVLSSRYGWRSRLSTSGYSGRTRTRSSIASSRADKDSSFSDSASSVLSNGRTSRYGTPDVTNLSYCKNRDVSSLEESMSEYGKKIAGKANLAAPTSSKKRISRSCFDSSQTATCNSDGDALDRLSKNLADEDPSFLLYGKPSNIALNLGLGKTSSFQDLNESLGAVKYRQNLPEARRLQMQLRDKVDSDIRRMKTEKPGLERRLSAFDSKDDIDDFDVRSADDFHFYSSDIEEDLLPPRPASSLLSSCSGFKPSMRHRLSNISHPSHRDLPHPAHNKLNQNLSSECASLIGSRTASMPPSCESDTEIIMRRHELLQKRRNKPFVSRFLKQPSRPDRASMQHFVDRPLSHANSCESLSGFSTDEFSNELVGDHFNTTSPSSTNRAFNGYEKRRRREVGSDSIHRYGNNLMSKPHNCVRPTSYDLFSDNEDVGVSRYRVARNSSSSDIGSNDFRPAVEDSIAMRRAKSNDLIFQSRNEMRSPDLCLSGSCNGSQESLDQLNNMSRNETPDPLDSIINKYLYRKSFASDDDDYTTRNGNVFNHAEGMS